MTMFYPMAERATILATCRKVFNSHKPIKELKKSKENMTPPIEKIESHSSVPKNMTSTTKKIKAIVLLTSKPKFQSLSHKLREVRLEWKSQKPFPIPDKAFSIILHPLQKTIQLTDTLVKENHMIQNLLLTNFMPTKTRRNSSKDSSKWNNPCFMGTIHKNKQRWELQHYMQINNPEPDQDFMTQIKQSKETESIILIRLIKKLKEFFNALMKIKKLESHQEMMLTKELKLT